MTNKLHQKELEFRDNWDSIANPGNRKTALAQELAVLDRWLLRLRDPDLGSVGEKFKAAFAATGCGEKIQDFSPDDDAPAMYIPFACSLSRKTTHLRNMIEYGLYSFSSRAYLFSARIHEMLHAIQYHSAPALHARIGNFQSPIVICPRDAALLTKFMEQDTYAKQAWMTSLALGDIPEGDPARTNFITEAFAQLRQQIGDLQGALSFASQLLMDMKDEKHDISSLGQDYCHRQLVSYNEILPSRLEDIRSGRVTLVRLDPEDIWEISAAFGPNIFGEKRPDPAFLADPDLKPESREILNKMNEQLGITDERNLLTLSQALKDRGMTRQDLLNIVLNPPPTVWQWAKQSALHFLGLG